LQRSLEKPKTRTRQNSQTESHGGHYLQSESHQNTAYPKMFLGFLATAISRVKQSVNDFER